MNINLAIAHPLLTGDIMQVTLIPATLPEIIVRRWTQALRVNTRADWKQMAELCGRTAINIFCDNDYNPEHSDFKAICQLARVAHLNGVACLTRPHLACWERA